MNRTLILVTALVCALALAGGAAAIVSERPTVRGTRTSGLCSPRRRTPTARGRPATGTLISRRVFLTAAHCDQGVARVAVTFDSDYDAATDASTGAHGMPIRRYNQRQATRTTSRSCVLDEPVKGSRLRGCRRRDRSARSGGARGSRPSATAPSP